jgi:hypothetical protein
VRQEIANGRLSGHATVSFAGSSRWMPIGQSIFAHQLGAFAKTELAEPQKDPLALFGRTVDAAAILLVVVFFLPRSLDGGVVFTWDELGKFEMGSGFVATFYPLGLGIALFLLNRFRVPAVVRAVAWALGASAPIVYTAIDYSAPLAPPLIVGGNVLLSALLFARYLRPRSTVFRFLPLLGVAALGAAYAFPIGGYGNTTPLITSCLKLFDAGGSLVLLGVLGLLPAAVAALALVVSLLPARGASRFAAYLVTTYLPLLLFAAALIGALAKGVESMAVELIGGASWLAVLAYALSLFALQSTAAAGFAGSVEAVAGPEPEAPPPPPVLS